MIQTLSDYAKVSSGRDKNYHWVCASLREAELSSLHRLGQATQDKKVGMESRLRLKG